MNKLFVILVLIALINGIFLIRLIKDVSLHKGTLKNESGNNITLIFSSIIIFFLSSFGICDYSISTIFYRMKKLVSDKKLPCTLNTQCVVPVSVMAFSFISSIQVDLTTLMVCIASQVFGAYLGPRFIVKLPLTIIRKVIAFGLFLTAFFILARKLQWMPLGGIEVGLHGIKLFIACFCLFLCGAMNNLGIGSYPLTMATLYSLGMSPLATFPIMMGACSFSTAVAGMQFIKYREYSRKITLFTSTFGVIGVLIAVNFIKSLNLSLLQWLIMIILFYSSISLLQREFKFKFLVTNSISND